MSDSWVAVAPIQHYWHLPDGIRVPFAFADGVMFQELPDWVRDEQFGQHLRPALRESLRDNTRYCITANYQADALGDPDPQAEPPGTRTIQDAAYEQLRFAAFALWLAKRTPLGFDCVFHARVDAREPVIRQMYEIQRFCPLTTYQHAEHDGPDFARAANLLGALRKCRVPAAVHSAAQGVVRGLMETAWVSRFLMMWLALEALFGPDDAREISFRISQRIALFLERGEAARQMFRSVKASYDWRSKVVHGLRLRRMTADKSLQLMDEVEIVLQRAFQKFLTDDELRNRFDSEGREAFLDELAYGAS